MRLIPALLAPVLVLACSKPSPPTVVAQRAAVTSVDVQAIHLDVTLSATNPNSFDVPMRDVQAHVVLDQHIDLGTMTLPNAMTLPAGKSTTIDVPVALRWTDLGAMAQLAASKTNVPFSVDGTVELGGKLLNVSVPFQITGTVSPQQLAGSAMKALPLLPR